MADYLTGLAARALGATPVVRPRPAAQFEPQPLEEAEVAAPVLTRGEPERVDATPPVRHASTEPPPLEHAAGEPALAAQAAAPRTVPARAGSRVRKRVRQAQRAEQIVPEEATMPPAYPDQPEPAAATPTPRAVVRPTTRRRRSEPAAPRQQVAREAPPVRVTIGRIEVRAVTPAAPAPQRRPPRRPPPLSLDDYLEQRQSGRR